MFCIKCSQKTTNIYKSQDNITTIYLCEMCSSELNEDSSPSEYRRSIEELLREFGKLMNLAEKAATTNKNKLPLRVRKQSILFRDTLKKFRQASLKHEKYINEKKTKWEIDIKERTMKIV